ncbi:hypothetical protein LN474_01060, partial [Xanthomonas codiaei]|uniref:hypothetical protein n=1 Tax=Xanthomonas codiaei TaxID=56463 RepID=UPI001E29C37D
LVGLHGSTATSKLRRGEGAAPSTRPEDNKAIAIRTMQSSLPDGAILADQAESGSSAPLLQGPVCAQARDAECRRRHALTVVGKDIRGR